MANLYLGTAPDGSRADLDASHLTTHAVCVGMTGSGKTGLGVVALEELARRRVPLLVLDPKGDLTNLLLTFPDLAGERFAPWLPPGETGADRGAAAAAVAARWRDGLAGSGLGGDDVRAVRTGLRWRLLTPGASLAPLDVLPALGCPAGLDLAADPDGAAERAQTAAAALLGLTGRGGGVLDRDGGLVAAVLLELWRRGERPDLARVLAALADPPLERLGVLPLDVAYPRPERFELVLALNTLLASPGFAAWTRGVPLDMDELLGSREDPCGTVLTLAHLDEAQRLFAIALVAAELAAWTRRQPASESLRALLYLDEVHGIVPPHPAAPAPKAPLLSLLKQGRAFGVGLWLATQNPVDLDYKALGNAGVKLVGRLVTERDRARALEGLGLTVLGDGRRADDVVAGLARRQFLVDDVRSSGPPRLLTTRWAMSYLRGPLALSELGPLVGAAAPGVPAVPAGVPAVPASAPASFAPAASSPPVLVADLPVRYAASGGAARVWLAARLRVRLASSAVALERTEEEWWRVPADDDGLDWSGAERLEQPPVLLEAPPADLRFPAAAPAGLGGDLADVNRALGRWRAQRATAVLANRTLRLAAAPDESRAAFAERCRVHADRADDGDQERIRQRYERRIEAVRRRLEREREELERDRSEVSSRRAEEALGTVEALFGVLTGRGGLRSAAARAARGARGAASKRRMRQRAESSVRESEAEIDRFEDELEELARQLEDELAAVAERSESEAAAIEALPVRPAIKDVEVLEVAAVWGP